MSESQEPDLPYSIIGPFLETWLQGCENFPDPLETLKSGFRSGQLHDVAKSLAEIDTVHREICLALKDFAPRPVGLFSNVLTIEQIILALKLYVISWATLLDILAALINKTFDLGFANTDVTYDLILRNKHVQNSELPAMLRKYSGRLDRLNLKHHRNEIVHRGRILDKEIEAAHEDRKALVSSRYSFLNEKRISEEEYKKESEEQTKRLCELAAQKKDFYGGHYRVTLEMVSELLTILAKKSLDLHKMKFA